VRAGRDEHHNRQTPAAPKLRALRLAFMLTSRCAVPAFVVLRALSSALGATRRLGESKPGSEN